MERTPGRGNSREGDPSGRSPEGRDGGDRGLCTGRGSPEAPPPGMSERERQVMKRLKEVVDKQRDEIRAKDRELGLKSEDVEAVSVTTPAPSQPGPRGPWASASHS